jgi:IS30 family transposase
MGVHRKPRIPKELMIENRAKEINKRDVFGHWECDLMIFRKGVKGNLITLRERLSRYTLAIKNGVVRPPSIGNRHN